MLSNRWDLRGASASVRISVAKVKTVNALIRLTHVLVLYIQELHAVLFVNKEKETN